MSDFNNKCNQCQDSDNADNDDGDDRPGVSFKVPKYPYYPKVRVGWVFGFLVDRFLHNFDNGWLHKIC
jgi:hypothetical protein